MLDSTIKRFGRWGKGYGLHENRLIKNMKAAHMLSAIAWGGGAFSMQALGFLRRSIEDATLAAQVGYCAHFVDTWVVMPGLLGCALTGLFYSLKTSIGFFKFAWIGYKWLITCCAGFWGTMFWGPWGDQLIWILQGYGLDYPLVFVRACILPENIWAGLMQTAIILSMCLISVYRPISFRFWLAGSEEKELSRRVMLVHMADSNNGEVSPLANSQVRTLYEQWFGRPLGILSRRHLHSRLRDKSERLAKLRQAGAYPPKTRVKSD